MRKVVKSIGDNSLIQYQRQAPQNLWKDFRDHDGGRAYKEIKGIVFNDQYFLCGYCEIDLNIKHVTDNGRRIEHFKSKSGCDVRVDNWNLDWNNLIGVCVGGQDFISKQRYLLPQNLSCDSHKDHYESRFKLIGNDKNWTGKIIYPLLLPKDHNLFNFDRNTGALSANVDYCNTMTFEINELGSTEQLVSNTIEVLNLNCERLRSARLTVFFEFERCIRIAREKKDISKIKNLIIRWCSGDPKFFQTTRDIIVRDSAVARGILSSS